MSEAHPENVRQLRPRDLIWDEMERLFGRVVSGTNGHKRRNKAVKDLKLMEAIPEELPRALRALNVAFPGITCTDIALATHFAQFRPRQISPPCPECGVGGGIHSIDCSRVT